MKPEAKYVVLKYYFTLFYELDVILYSVSCKRV